MNLLCRIDIHNWELEDKLINFESKNKFFNTRLKYRVCTRCGVKERLVFSNYFERIWRRYPHGV